MGNLSDSLRTLVDEITAATHHRRHHLRALTEESRETRHAWQSELQEVSRSLRDHFDANRAQRATATQARRQATDQCMDDIHRAHQDRAQTLRDCFISHNQTRRQTTRQFIDESHQAHQDRVRTLEDYFDANRVQRATATQARQQAASQLMDAIQRVHEQCRVTVSELRSDAYNMIERFGLERQDMAKTVQERLSSASQARQELVQEIRDAALATLGELVADRRQAHQNWTEGLKKKCVPETMTAAAAAEVAVVEEVAAQVEAQPEVEAVRPLSLEERVLEVIARHAEGIRLVDIGNDLGVDWRSLLGISRTIVDEDKVERIDNRYYPKGRSMSEAGEEA